MFYILILLTCLFAQAGEHMVGKSETINAKQAIMEMSSAFILSRAIHVAAQLGVADHMTQGACTLDTLAENVSADPQALYRLMRLLASYNIFCEEQNKCFSLTPLAIPLLSDHPESLRAWLMHHDSDEMRWRAYGNMTYSVKHNAPAFNHLFEQGYFDLISQNPSMAAGFDEGMKNISMQEETLLAQAYPFGSYETIADIGGGKGNFLAQVLMLNENLQGILYDLDHALTSAKSYLATTTCSHRISCKAGSFFESIPGNADVYVLKRILHDWNDEQCIAILQNCKNAMKPGARLLIIDAIVSTDNQRDFTKDIDIAMLVLFGGKERTLQEWQSLIDAVGLRIHALHKTESLVQIIEITA